nr:hypothetical protein [Tanacetum cinerariifolium]
MKYHLLYKRLIDLMMMVLVRQTEECDMMVHMEKSDMLMLVAEIEVGDKTADDVDKLACSANVVKLRQTEECDMMVHMEKSDMLMLVAEIEVGDKTADDVDKLACSANVVKLRQREEKRIEEEQVAKAQNSKIPACCDDDDDYNSIITPNEPVDSLSMGDEYLNTIPTMESDEFIKSFVENLVPNPSESEGKNGCDMLACFTTFSNILFEADYESDSVDDQSLSDEDFLGEIFSNPLFEEEIISTKIDPHHFDAESDLIESMLNHDSSIISSSSKTDSLLDEFAGELTLLKSISLGIDDTDCHPENEIHLTKRLLYDNLSPRPLKEFVSENSNAEIKSFSPSSIPIKDSDSFIEELDLTFTPNDPMSPSIKDDDDDSEGDNLFLERLLQDDPIPLPDTLDFSYAIRVFLPFFTYPVTSLILYSFRNEDTIFDPGIAINRFLFV